MMHDQHERREADWQAVRRALLVVLRARHGCERAIREHGEFAGSEALIRGLLSTGRVLEMVASEVKAGEHDTTGEYDGPSCAGFDCHERWYHKGEDRCTCGEVSIADRGAW